MATLIGCESSASEKKQDEYYQEDNNAETIDDIHISGRLYEFDEKSNYEYSSAETYNAITGNGKLGVLSISGKMKNISKVNGFDAYEVQDGVIGLTYSLGNTLLETVDTDLHIVEDKSSKVDTESLDSKILNGAIILQTSLDGEKWITDVVKTNIADETSEFKTDFYETKGIQQVNGCFYRIIVAYKTEKRLPDTKVGIVSKKNYEYKKYAEIYDFYLIDSYNNSSKATSPEATPKKELGKKINTGKDNGFSGNKPITNKDPHFGWDIGTFYLNGYTREQPTTENEVPIFLKTVGDKVTLWFNLNEDITRLNGKDNLSINEDINGYDQYFGIEKTNFKHGALIIQFTDYEGKVHEPLIYTDYLAANATTGANTKVELFEEGDYEVALDYEIKDSSGTDSYNNYRINFKFKIRNGNCMVYPFDAISGTELSNNALAENGFRLDLAKSRYLTIDIVRSAIKKENDRYSLDVRVNTAAKEGITYTSEGIYSFTVKNPSTGDSITKTIYVGSSPIYKALANGKTIDDVNAMLDQGGILQNDGSILMLDPEETAESDETEKEGIFGKILKFWAK